MVKWNWLLCVALILVVGESGRKGCKRLLTEAPSETANARGTATEPSSSSNAVRGLGGIRQRLEAAATNAIAQSPDSSLPLNRELKGDWVRGKISSEQVQRFANAAGNQGMPGAERMARLGASGEHLSNMFRALYAMMGHPEDAPQIQWIDIPTSRGRKTPFPFLLPHELFESFYNARNRKDLWKQSIIGALGAAAEFWEGQRDMPYVSLHPYLTDHAKRKKSIPIGLHADGGAFNKNDNLFTISWNSLLADGQTLHKRFLFTVIKKSDFVADTLDSIWKIFAWSMNLLGRGEKPDTNYLGRHVLRENPCLAGGWRGILCQVRGDWQFFQEAFYFPHWNAGERMCWMCLASGTIEHLLFTNCRANAPWRDTIFTHDSYLAHQHANGLVLPVLLALVVGFRLDMFMVDTLHAVDLGMCAHVLGNIFWIMAVRRRVLGGRTHALAIANLETYIKSWVKRTRCPSGLRGKLTVERVRTSNGWPKLKCKGATARHLIVCGLALMNEFGNPADLQDAQMIALCTLLSRFYDILYENSFFLSAAAKLEMPRLGQRFAEIYTNLARGAVEAGVRCWKLAPKLHLWEHLTEYQAVHFGNPRYYWCYADEDLVGLIVGLASGVHPITLPESLLFKWLHIQFG